MNLGQAVYRAGQNIAARTGRPVPATDIAKSTGVDDATVQQILADLDAKGYIADALRGDDRIDAVAFS
ncbi:helix-turn-helix domain-containing protein [Mycobacterium simiae]|uniref:helix-turn-helix domain-containing protein n=1 Tax=Mycobacterium simiae TaxID=1784 RepID=UPI00262C82DE|nr:helix-turn-helix domain-containing protein [Mycobacterium simiae]